MKSTGETANFYEKSSVEWNGLKYELEKLANSEMNKVGINQLVIELVVE